MNTFGVYIIGILVGVFVGVFATTAIFHSSGISSNKVIVPKLKITISEGNSDTLFIYKK